MATDDDSTDNLLEMLEDEDDDDIDMDDIRLLDDDDLGLAVQNGVEPPDDISQSSKVEDSDDFEGSSRSDCKCEDSEVPTTSKNEHIAECRDSLANNKANFEVSSTSKNDDGDSKCIPETKNSCMQSEPTLENDYVNFESQPTKTDILSQTSPSLTKIGGLSPETPSSTKDFEQVSVTKNDCVSSDVALSITQNHVSSEKLLTVKNIGTSIQSQTAPIIKQDLASLKTISLNRKDEISLENKDSTANHIDHYKKHSESAGMASYQTKEHEQRAFLGAFQQFLLSVSSDQETSENSVAVKSGQPDSPRTQKNIVPSALPQVNAVSVPLKQSQVKETFNNYSKEKDNNKIVKPYYDKKLDQLQVRVVLSDIFTENGKLVSDIGDIKLVKPKERNSPQKGKKKQNIPDQLHNSKSGAVCKTTPSINVSTSRLASSLSVGHGSATDSSVTTEMSRTTGISDRVTEQREKNPSFPNHEVISIDEDDNDEIPSTEYVSDTVLNPPSDQHHCYLCDVQFNCSKNLLIHIRSSHSYYPDLTLHGCTHCGTEYNSRTVLFQHERMVHSLDLACPFCGKNQPTKDALQIHVCNHLQPLTYLCMLCREDFPNVMDTEKHLSKHKGEVAFWSDFLKCRFCGSLFNKRQKLYDHVMKLHNDLFQIKCKSCHQLFYSQAAVLVHRSDKSHYLDGKKIRSSDNIQIKFEVTSEKVSRELIDISEDGSFESHNEVCALKLKDKCKSASSNIIEQNHVELLHNLGNLESQNTSDSSKTQKQSSDRAENITSSPSISVQKRIENKQSVPPPSTSMIPSVVTEVLQDQVPTGRETARTTVKHMLRTSLLSTGTPVTDLAGVLPSKEEMENQSLENFYQKLMYNIGFHIDKLLGDSLTIEGYLDGKSHLFLASVYDQKYKVIMVLWDELQNVSAAVKKKIYALDNKLSKELINALLKGVLTECHKILGDTQKGIMFMGSCIVKALEELLTIMVNVNLPLLPGLQMVAVDHYKKWLEFFPEICEGQCKIFKQVSTYNTEMNNDEQVKDILRKLWHFRMKLSGHLQKQKGEVQKWIESEQLPQVSAVPQTNTRIQMKLTSNTAVFVPGQSNPVTVDSVKAGSQVMIPIHIPSPEEKSDVSFSGTIQTESLKKTCIPGVIAPGQPQNGFCLAYVSPDFMKNRLFNAEEMLLHKSSTQSEPISIDLVSDDDDEDNIRKTKNRNVVLSNNTDDQHGDINTNSSALEALVMDCTEDDQSDEEAQVSIGVSKDGGESEKASRVLIVANKDNGNEANQMELDCVDIKPEPNDYSGMVIDLCLTDDDEDVGVDDDDDKAKKKEIRKENEPGKEGDDGDKTNGEENPVAFVICNKENNEEIKVVLASDKENIEDCRIGQLDEGCQAPVSEGKKGPGSESLCKKEILAKEEADRIIEELKEATNRNNTSGSTPLHVAAGFNNVEIIELLLQHGADIHAKDNRGLAPLHRACMRGHVEATELLIKAGADINGQDNSKSTPLHEAITNSHISVAHCLLKAGADPTIFNSSFKSPIDCAPTRDLKETFIQYATKYTRKRKTGTEPPGSGQQETASLLQPGSIPVPNKKLKLVQVFNGGSFEKNSKPSSSTNTSQLGPSTDAINNATHTVNPKSPSTVIKSEPIVDKISVKKEPSLGDIQVKKEPLEQVAISCHHETTHQNFSLSRIKSEPPDTHPRADNILKSSENSFNNVKQLETEATSTNKLISGEIQNQLKLEKDGENHGSTSIQTPGDGVTPLSDAEVLLQYYS